MFKLILIFVFITVVFIFFKKFVMKFNEIIFKVNPYFQTIIVATLLIILLYILIFFKVDVKSVSNIITFSFIIGTIYVGVVFQQYYFKLSDQFSQKLRK